jgi:hypothetical protein
MPTRSALFRNALLFLAACLILGCSKGGSLGCGSGKKTTSDERSETALEGSSKLVGVYRVTGYQQSEGTCEKLVDLSPAPSHLVLYAFEPSDGGPTRLGGAFCGGADLCRAVAKQASEPVIGYSFLSGDQASGWQGWAVTETGSAAEQKCAATIQSHNLSSSGQDTIRIETKTVDVVFAPDSEEEGVATCSNKAAIAVASTEPSCKSRLVLAATRETDR